MNRELGLKWSKYKVELQIKSIFKIFFRYQIPIPIPDEENKWN